MDFIGPLPPSPEGCNFIWVVIDRLTSMIHLVALKTSATATEVAERYLHEIVRLHGVASSIVSDRDPRFTSIFWNEVHRMLGTRLMMSTSFHPQTDGATERANRVINTVLRAVIQPDQSDWYEKLPLGSWRNTIQLGLHAVLQALPRQRTRQTTYPASTP